MTITSNIHIGLAAWSTGHSYSIGNRVSNNGTAYQAISSGISGTNAPIGVAADVYDNGVHWKYLSAIDYTSLAAWEASIPRTMIDSAVGQLWNDGAITTSSGVPFLTVGIPGSPRIMGHGISIILTTAPGESFRDTIRASGSVALFANAAIGVCFQLPTTGVGNCNYFDVYDNITFSNLQFINVNSSSGSAIVNGNSVNIGIQNCIIDGYSAVPMVNSTSMLGLINTLIIDRQATGSNGIAVSAGNNTASFVINCTFVRIHPTDGTETAAYGYSINDTGFNTSVVENNIFSGYKFPFHGSNSAGILVSHCALTSISVGFAADNGNNLFSISNPFFNAANDFRLQNGPWVNTGAILNQYNASNDDIDGYSRSIGPSWSMGAAEYTSQLVSNVAIPFKLIATGSLTDNASLISSIGTIRCVATAQQFDPLSTVKSIIITANGQAHLDDLASGTMTIGLRINSAINISSNNLSASAAINLTNVGSASVFDLANGSGRLGLTLAATFSRTVLLAPTTTTIALSTIGNISPSIVHIVASGSLPISAIGMLRIIDSGHAAIGLGLSVRANIVLSTMSAIITLRFSTRAIIAPRLRISQLPIEILTGGGNLRVSQMAAEILTKGSNIRVSQSSIEVLVRSPIAPIGRVTQLLGEVLATGTPRAIISQAVQEIITGGIGNQNNVHISQVLSAVLVGGSSTQNVIMTQVVLEVLIPAVPLPKIGTTYMSS